MEQAPRKAKLKAEPLPIPPQLPMVMEGMERVRFPTSIQNDFQWENLYKHKYKTCVYPEKTWKETYEKRLGNQFFPLVRLINDDTYHSYHLHFLISSCPEHSAKLLCESLILVMERQEAQENGICTLMFLKRIIEAELRVTDGIMEHSSTSHRLFSAYCKIHSQQLLSDLVQQCYERIKRDTRTGRSYLFQGAPTKSSRSKGDKPMSPRTPKRVSKPSEPLNTTQIHIGTRGIPNLIDAMEFFLQLLCDSIDLMPLGMRFLAMFLQSAWNERLKRVLRKNGYNVAAILSPETTVEDQAMLGNTTSIVSSIVDNTVVRYFLFKGWLLPALRDPGKHGVTVDDEDSIVFSHCRYLFFKVLKCVTDISPLAPSNTVQKEMENLSRLNLWIRTEEFTRRFLATLLAQEPAMGSELTVITPEVQDACLMAIYNTFTDSRLSVMKHITDSTTFTVEGAKRLAERIASVLEECNPTARAIKLKKGTH